MVTKFDTTSSGTQSSGGGSTKMVLIVLGLALAGYGFYKFVYLPKKQKEEQSKQDE